jgi:hypothetical protein
MRSNAGTANRQGDVDLRFAQVSFPSQNFGLACLSISQHSHQAENASDQEEPFRKKQEEIAGPGTAKEGYRPHTPRDSHRYPLEGVTVAGTTEGVNVVGTTEGVTLSAWRPRSNFVVTFPKGVTSSKLANIASTLYDYLTLINIVYVLTVIVITSNPTVSHIYWWPPTKNTPHILVTPDEEHATRDNFSFSS